MLIKKDIMKTTTLRILIIASFFATQLAEAQVALDTLFVANRKSMEEVTQTRYYYYPNLQAYFDTRIAMFVHQENGQWVTSETINPIVRGYSLKNNMYVVLQGYYDDEPYKKLVEHRKQYPADYSSRPKPPTVINYAAKAKKPTAVVAIN